MEDNARTSTRQLDKTSFALSSVGLGLCISSTEALRYSALWHVSDEGTLDTLVFKVLAVIAVFGIVLYLSRTNDITLHDKPAALAAIATLQTVGFVLLIASVGNPDMPHEVAVLRNTILESSYVLFVVYAGFFAATTMGTIIHAFAIAVIIAGAIQTCIVFFPFWLASTLVLLFTPLSSAFVFMAAKKQHASDLWIASLPEHERELFAATDNDARHLPENPGTGPKQKPRISLGQLCLAIALFSFIVASIHLQWVRAQDSQLTSVIIQICAGVGTILAGNLLLLVRTSMHDSELVDSVRLLILPIALATLYFASLLSGALIALSVIPLNITYIAVLFLAWISPFVYRTKRTPVFASATLFLAKKLGVVIGLGIMRDVARGDFEWVGTVLISATLFILIMLSVVDFMKANRRRNATVAASTTPAMDSERLQEKACDNVADRCKLTKREREVLKLLVRGRTAAYIAETLVISDTTAKTHIKHIYQKTGVTSKQVLLDIVEDELAGLSGSQNTR